MKMKIIISVSVTVLLAFGFMIYSFIAEGNSKKAEEHVISANTYVDSVYKEMKENLQFVEENGTLAKLNESKLAKAKKLYRDAVLAVENTSYLKKEKFNSVLKSQISPKLNEIIDFQKSVKIAKEIDHQSIIFDKKIRERATDVKTSQQILFQSKIDKEIKKFSFIKNKEVKDVFEKLYSSKVAMQ